MSIFGAMLVPAAPDACTINVTVPAAAIVTYVPTYPSLLNVTSVPDAAPLDRNANVDPLIVAPHPAPAAANTNRHALPEINSVFKITTLRQQSGTAIPT
jgi:hypothetical protein